MPALDDRQALRRSGVLTYFGDGATLSARLELGPAALQALGLEPVAVPAEVHGAQLKAGFAD